MTRISFASTEMSDRFDEGQKRLQELLGIKGWMITDISQMYDFDPDPHHLRAISAAVGYRVSGDQLVWKVCRDLQRP